MCRFAFLSLLLVLLANSRCHGFGVARNPDASSSAPLSSTLQLQIQRAVQLSSAGTSNITAAHNACQAWRPIILQAESAPEFFDNTVLLLCQALYASSLVRTGRDDEAVSVYDLALNNSIPNTDGGPLNNQCDLLFGKAQAHRRLLQYGKAKESFQLLCTLNPNSYVYMMGTATCCMRLNQPDEACAAVEAYCDNVTPQDTNSNDVINARAFLAVLQYVLKKENASAIVMSLQKAATASLLYRWIYETLVSSDDNVLVTRKTLDADTSCDSLFFQLLQINLFPLDDPGLMVLDDKVHLHRLLGSSKEATRWPLGLILPEEGSQLQGLLLQQTTPKLWIAKKRAGYGSHGNEIVSLQQMASRFSESTHCQEEILLQELIDPTLLIDGRKFSLRIYVVYFSPGEAYLSSEGLVKIASAVRSSSGELEDRAYMTNSGREERMEQHDLKYLSGKSMLFDGASEYDAFWSRIRESVRGVMSSFRQQHLIDKEVVCSSSWNERRASLYIPKIMGFDYVIDKDYIPWLLEVNRFPGLEPRDSSSDRRVKHQVMVDAWMCANRKRRKRIEKATPETHPFQCILKDLSPMTDQTLYSLEKLQ